MHIVCLHDGYNYCNTRGYFKLTLEPYVLRPSIVKRMLVQQQKTLFILFLPKKKKIILCNGFSLLSHLLLLSSFMSFAAYYLFIVLNVRPHGLLAISCAERHCPIHIALKNIQPFHATENSLIALPVMGSCEY